MLCWLAWNCSLRLWKNLSLLALCIFVNPIECVASRVMSRNTVYRELFSYGYHSHVCPAVFGGGVTLIYIRRSARRSGNLITQLSNYGSSRIADTHIVVIHIVMIINVQLRSLIIAFDWSLSYWHQVTTPLDFHDIHIVPKLTTTIYVHYSQYTLPIHLLVYKSFFFLSTKICLQIYTYTHTHMVKTQDFVKK